MAGFAHNNGTVGRGTVRPTLDPTRMKDWQIADAAKASMKPFLALGRELGLQDDELIPMGQCAKQQRNGPCGGSTDGMCEVYPDEKPCVWTKVYRRLKSVGRLDEMRGAYVPARKAELGYTSGWANYFLGRDHAAPQVKKEAPEGVH